MIRRPLQAALRLGANVTASLGKVTAERVVCGSPLTLGVNPLFAAHMALHNSKQPG